MLRLCLVSILAVSTLAAAGPMSDALPRLTEDVVVRMLPVMRAQVGEAEAGMAALQEALARSQERAQLLEDIDAGKVDPLNWLKSRSDYFVAPPSAQYKPELSRWASASYFSDPVAMFSFGVEAPEKIRKAAIDGETGLSVVLSGEAIYDLPGGKQLKAAEDEVRRFYPTNKFTLDPLQHFLMVTYTSPDTSVFVLFEYTNMFAEVPASRGVPNGPILMLSLSSARISPEDVAEPRDSSAVAASGFGAALAQAGMTEESYGLYLGALVMAKNDALDPSVLEVDLSTSGLPPEEAKTVKDLLEMYAIRRGNLKIYRRVAPQVGPLLEALGQ
jgi:hypothetical protein